MSEQSTESELVRNQAQPAAESIVATGVEKLGVEIEGKGDIAGGEDVTGTDMGLSGVDQIWCALSAIRNHGGSATISQIYAALNTRIAPNFLSKQGRASLRFFVNKVAVEKGFIEKHDPSSPGWRSTPAGDAFWENHPPPVPSAISSVPASGATSGRAVPKQGEDLSETWVFQANPRYYDIRGALAAVSELTWLANQHRDQMQAGQQVLIWESGKAGGVLALAEIMGEPARGMEDLDSDIFSRGEHKFDSNQYKVMLRIQKVFAAPLTRTELKQHPVLGELQILRQPHGTNYRLTVAQALSFQELLHASAPVVDTPKFSIEDAMEDVFLEQAEFESILAALELKKNIILQGPPGVGKTFLAKKLAFALMGQKDSSRVGIVQFHQAMSYEDFIQGWRPTAGGGFERKNGIFYEFCQRAQRDPTRKYVFILDEINRGNLSKIFGELMMLIEADKRGPEYAIPITYSHHVDEVFYVPANVYLMGMMNTADRSLALVDYALRRRFRFFSLRPCFASSRFQNHLRDTGIDDDTITRLIDNIGLLNQTVSADAKNLGWGYQIGHSYFCANSNEAPLGYEWYENIIRNEVLPLLEEYWFDDPQKVEHWAHKLLK